MTTCRIITKVKKVLSSGVLKLEGYDGYIWKNDFKNYISCHLPNINGTIDPNLSMIFASLKCILCCVIELKKLLQ